VQSLPGGVHSGMAEKTPMELARRQPPRGHKQFQYFVASLGQSHGWGSSSVAPH